MDVTALFQRALLILDGLLRADMDAAHAQFTPMLPLGLLLPHLDIVEGTGLSADSAPVAGLCDPVVAVQSLELIDHGVYQGGYIPVNPQL